jgi:hypothetical protein
MYPQEIRLKTLILFDSKNEFDSLVSHLSDESTRVFFHHVPNLEDLVFELKKKMGSYYLGLFFFS